jgi:Kef-type K+ transport system membrane component KefB
MSIVSTDLFRLLLVGIVACLAPLLIYITHASLLPAVVLEIVGGIIIGPQVLHWVYVDPILRYLSLMGLSYLLFLSGMVPLPRVPGITPVI